MIITVVIPYAVMAATFRNIGGNDHVAAAIVAQCHRQYRF